MKLIQFKILGALVENNLNISRAARQLNLAQSAASRQLILLEQELKTDLFVRNGRRFIQLTDAGQSVVSCVRRILLEETNIFHLSKNANEKSEKNLIIGTTHTQARYFLPAIIRRLSKKYPTLTYQITQASPMEVANLLDQNKIHIAICTEMLDRFAVFNTFDCYRWEHVVVIPHAHSLAKQKTISLRQLQEYDVITYQKGFTGRLSLNKLFEENKARLKVILSASDSDVIKTYVRLNIGIGILNQVAYTPFDREHLSVLAIEGNQAQCTTKLAIHRSMFLPKYYQEIISIALDEGKRLEATLVKGKR